MEMQDVVRLTFATIRSHRLRAFLTMLGIAIGTASVILLTSIGEGLRVFVMEQFMQFGTNLLAIHPGKAQTFGMPGLATTTRKLTLEDAEELRRVSGVERIVPLCFGSARVEYQGRGRSVFIYGVNSEVPDVWRFRVQRGRFLPGGDPRRASPLTVLGPTLMKELFGEKNPLGEAVRIGGRRFVVIGIMEPKGQMLGIDIDDSAYIPVAAAMDLFNKEGLNEIDVLFSDAKSAESVTAAITALLKERHGREEDFTVITQTEMLASLDKILRILTMAIGAIAAISLIVGAVGILTMMWISVNERISEIGLEKAIGAEGRQILVLFLFEAALLSTIGGLAGVIVGLGLAFLLHSFLPALPVEVPTLYVVLALIVSLLVGLASGVFPARRAARLDPLEALRAE